jgi:hypothetical protein
MNDNNSGRLRTNSERSATRVSRNRSPETPGARCPVLDSETWDRTNPPCRGDLPANALNVEAMDSRLILLVVNAGDEEPRA